MKKIYPCSIGIFLLVCGLAVSPVALAQDDYYDVILATPASATQGTLNLDVEIAGDSFDNTVDVVEFLVNCGEAPCTENLGGITVKSFKVRGSKKIIANIDVSDTAVVADFDIAVRSTSRGRGGKGTTLFRVQSKDGSVGNDNHIGRAMICTLNEEEDPDATVMDDGHPVYEHGVEQVLCLSGNVTGDHLSPLRFANLPGGNPKQIKFATRFLDLAFGDCTPVDEAKLGCNNLPSELINGGTLDTAYMHVAPYADQNHIHLMDPGLHGLAMFIDPRGFDERYSIQMSNRTEGPGNKNLWCFDAEGYETTDDINVFIWEDGVYSGVRDGLPDGYTVTTGDIASPESEGGNPPTIVYPDTGYAQALVCSNVGPGGESCDGRKNRDDLCFVLGKVDIRFTMHMEYR